MLTLHGSFNEAEFCRATLDGRCDLGGIADGETYVDLRIGAPEGDQVARKPIIGNRLA